MSDHPAATEPEGVPGGLPSEPVPPDTGATGQPGRFCRTCIPWMVRRRGLVLGVALVVFLVGGYFSTRLYANLRSGFEELLPDTAPSVIAARTVAKKLHNVTHLGIVFEGRDGDALERLADDLAARLRQLPPSLVESVQYRTDEEERFVRQFGGLELTTQELDSIQRRIDARIAWEKRKANPLTNLLDDEEELGPAPKLDFDDIAKGIEDRFGFSSKDSDRFRNGYLQSPDGKLLVMLVRPPESATGLETNQRILDAVRGAVAAAQPTRYDPTVRVGYEGEVVTLIEEQQALVADLLLSTVVVLVLTFTVLWIYFRRWTAIFSILGALGVGCAATFGLSWFLIGYLNANTAFLGSIVVGNGINVSIIVVARFLEERRRGVPMEQAIQVAWSSTVAATFVAAFSAGLAYLSLAVTDFKGFSQFGVIGGMGMALCWATSYLLLPPLLAALDGRSRRAVQPNHHAIVGPLISATAIHHGRLVRWASLALLLASVVGVLCYRGGLIEFDLDKLRAAKSAENGGQYWGKKVDQVLNKYLTPILIRGDSPEDLRKAVARLDARRAALGAADPLRHVLTYEEVVPPPAEQQARIARLHKLRATLTDSRLAQLDPALRKRVLDLRPPQDLRPVTIADVPISIRLPLVERDGTVGQTAAAYPKKVGFISQQESKEIRDLILSSIQEAGAKAQAVGQFMLFLDIADAIVRDGPVATGFAFAAVLLLVVLSMRRLRPTVEVLGSLLLGVAWLVGVAAWARVRLNFLNFVVLPITFGIGVDYAVNIVQRWRLEGPGSLERVLRETGGAVALCSLTTIIGYGSLLVADNRALRGFGLFASIGEWACLTAALVALPAWLLRPRKRPAAPPPTKG